MRGSTVRKFGRHSILVRSALVLLAGFVVAGAITVSLSLVFTGERQRRAADERLNQLLDTVESTVQVACFVKDPKLADEVAQGLLKNKEVLAVTIKTDGTDLARETLPGSPPNQAVWDPRLTRDVFSPFNADKVIGQIRIAANTRAIERAVYEEVRFVVLQIVGQLVLIALTVVAVMLVFIMRPIKAMSDGLHRMDATKGERLAVPPKHADSEIGRLVEDINNLAGNLVAALSQERTLRQEKEVEEKKYRSIFENAETGIFIATPDGELVSWNPWFAHLTGIPPSDAYRGALNMRHLPWDNGSRIGELALRCHLDNAGLSDDLAIRPRNGGLRWLNVILNPIGDNQVQGVVHDVTDLKQAEASARMQVITDRLTGLNNRIGLEERLQGLLNDPLISQTGGFTLMMADLDNFRHINEGFGLPVGDALLKDTTARLANCIKGGDSVARLAGDRFALALESVTGKDDIDRIAERILESIRKPFHVEGAPVNIHASLGITIFPKDGSDVPGLLRNAELALDRAKASGGDRYVYFDAALSEAAEQRRQVENDLRLAVTNREFTLYFQPIVDLAGNRLAGAEALIRWSHPRVGPVPPDTFIPLAEEVGLIDEIGLWTLDTACRTLAQWQRAGADRYLSINVSGRQIPDGLTPTALADAMHRHGVAPSKLALEITEGVLLADIDKALAWLEAVRGLGFRVFLDDFGTGYSSLSYLKRFPVDSLKIDKSFVRDMGDDSNDRGLIEAVVAMGRSLDMNVIAEGVETERQLNLLRGMNCHYAQGYYFSRPVPAEQFEEAATRIGGLLNNGWAPA
jgi:diguanylate cyclase (GGDEF)-like protein/PAS domain S-box-containing protein